MVEVEVEQYMVLQEQQPLMVARVHLARMDLAVEVSLQTVAQIAVVHRQ